MLVCREKLKKRSWHSLKNNNTIFTIFDLSKHNTKQNLPNYCISGKLQMKMRLKMRRKFAGFWFWWEPSRGVGQQALLRQSMPCNLISNCFFLESPWSSQPNCGPPSWQNTNNSPGEEQVWWSSWWSLSQCLTSSRPWAPPSRRLATRWSRRRSPRPSDNTCRTATEHTPVSTAELTLPTTTN